MNDEDMDLAILHNHRFPTEHSRGASSLAKRNHPVQRPPAHFAKSFGYCRVIRTPHDLPASKMPPPAERIAQNAYSTPSDLILANHLVRPFLARHSLTRVASLSSWYQPLLKAPASRPLQDISTPPRFIDIVHRNGPNASVSKYKAERGAVWINRASIRLDHYSCSHRAWFALSMGPLPSVA
jgi:hypothetical protein